MFRKLLGWLWNRWVISALGIALLCLIIWYLGEFIAFAGWAPLEYPETRLVVIFMIVAFWLVQTVWSLLKARKTDAQVMDGLASAPEAPDAGSQASDEEIAALRDRFKESLAVLRKAKLGGRGGRRRLYQLPWYLIIGPPGAGKTTALKNSGLKFPLMDRFGKDAIQGVGGTRNCDWWFTDEAVLLDTAGRYTTQDSDEAVDSAAWSGFLQLLRRHRRRRPIDGVIVAFSLLDIAQQSSNERGLHAQAVRKRLQELAGELKVKVPVYVVFTKCDLIAGFVEFFDDLGREGRGQVWGMTFPLQRSQQPESAVPAFAAEFDALVQRLDNRMTFRLDQERDPRRRGAIYGFTQQFGGLKDVLADFLGETFQPTRFEEPCLLRGIYFSSGTQEGNPIDRVLSSISGTFGLDRQALPAFSGPGRSYFLTRLLRDVVFQEADLVGHTGLLHTYRGWIQRGAYALTGLALLTLTAAWTTSFLSNQSYIGEVESEVEAYRTITKDLAQGEASIKEVLRPLDELRAVSGGYEDRDRPVSLAMGFGLYQGDKLGDAAVSAYRRALNAMLLPPIVNGLEHQIRAYAAADQPEILYQALKAYLMVSHPEVFDPEFFRFWVLLDWNRQLPGAANKAMRDSFASHLTALLEYDFDAPQADSRLVKQARAVLSHEPVESRVFADLKQQAQQSRLEEWRATEVLGDAANRYFRRKSDRSMSEGLPGLFTRAGFTDFFLAKSPELVKVAVDESWVLGPEYSERLGDLDPKQLTAAVSSLYFEEYAQVWEDYLADVDIVEFKSFGEGSEVARVLSDPDSPISLLLSGVTKETNLTALDPDLAGEAVSGRLANIKAQFEKLLEVAPAAQAAGLLANPAEVVELRFEDIHDLFRTDTGKPPIDRVLALIFDLYAYMKTARRTGGDDDEAVDNLRIESGVQPEPLGRWLATLARQTTALTARNVRERLNSAWSGEMARYCRRAFSNRYPLIKDSTNDANLSDFARFFGPQGMMDSFIAKHLSPFVDTTVTPWQARSASGVSLGISGSTLQQFERADRIREAFFPGNSAVPKIRFEMRAVKLTKAARHVLFKLGEEKELLYRHVDTRWKPMEWPPPDGLMQALVEFKPVSGSARPRIKKEGDWALFRLIDAGRLSGTGRSELYRLSFSADGLEAQFEVKATSVNNAFDRSIIGGFQCLGSL